MTTEKFNEIFKKDKLAAVVAVAVEAGDNGFEFKPIFRPTAHGDVEHRVDAIRYHNNKLQGRITQHGLWIELDTRPGYFNYTDPNILAEFVRLSL